MLGQEIISPLEARRVLADLEAQRRAAEARQVDLAAERQRIAFDASTGGAAARKTLDALTKEAIGAGLEIDNLDHALVEARRRVGQADEEARLAALRARARQARDQLAELRQQGDAAGAALAAFGAAFAGFLGIADDVRKLGMGGPGRELVLVNVRRVIQSELLQFHLQTEVIAPSERRTLGDLVTTWANQIEARIADALGDDQQEAA
jgi:hypothetical protein